MQVEGRAGSKAWGQSLLGTFRKNRRGEPGPAFGAERPNKRGRGKGEDPCRTSEDSEDESQGGALSMERHDLRVMRKPSSQGVWKIRCRTAGGELSSGAHAQPPMETFHVNVTSTSWMESLRVRNSRLPLYKGKVNKYATKGEGEKLVGPPIFHCSDVRTFIHFFSSVMFSHHELVRREGKKQQKGSILCPVWASLWRSPPGLP